MPIPCLPSFLLCTFLILGTFTACAENNDSSFVSTYFSRISPAWSPGAQDSIEAFEKMMTNEQRKEFYHFFYSRYLMQNGRFEQSTRQAEKGALLLKKDTNDLGIIKFYNLIASNASYTKDYVKAVRYFNRSIAISEQHGNNRQTAYLNNNIANIFFSIQDYPASYKYAQKAYTLLSSFPTDQYLAMITAILSVAEAKTGRMPEAEKHAREAHRLAETNNDIVSIIVADYAFGDIALSQKEYSRALEKFTASLTLSDQIQHLHLSMLNNIGLMNASLGLGEYAQAAEYGENALSLATLLNNSNTLYSIHRRLSKAYDALKQPDKAYTHLKTAFELYQETTSAEKQEVINDILIKYDTEKKEKEIARQQVLLLEKDVQTSNFRQVILILSALLILSILFFFFVRYRNRQRALHLRSENERKTLDALIRGEEVERTRIANELHDGLASSIAAVRFQLENAEMVSERNKQDILEMLVRAHEDTRRISHNLSPVLLEKVGLEASLTQFALENSTDQCTVHFALTGEPEVPENTALIIYRTIQELVQNALKHAAANRINVNLVRIPKRIRIMVEDNGHGFDPTSIGEGGGLKNMENRLLGIGGDFEIDSSIGSGTVIHIELPI